MTRSFGCGVMVEYCGSMVCYRQVASVHCDEKLVKKLPVLPLFVKKISQKILQNVSLKMLCF
jgi:hypothetical protein